jgi:hypothetical protein
MCDFSFVMDEADEFKKPGCAASEVGVKCISTKPLIVSLRPKMENSLRGRAAHDSLP